MVERNQNPKANNGTARRSAKPRHFLQYVIGGLLSKAVAVVYFRGEESSTADRCQQLIDVFKLTQSEARFAWSIAQGLSIAESAEKHGLTIETARNYSKKIYSKTGAKGQVDFMRRVLTSVVALRVH